MLSGIGRYKNKASSSTAKAAWSSGTGKHTEEVRVRNWKTDVAAYLKIALGVLFVGLKFYHHQELTEADYVILGALGLGAAGSKAAADAPKDPPA